MGRIKIKNWGRRIDSWRHGIHIKNVKINLWIGREWYRNDLRANWKEDNWQPERY